MDKRLDRRTKDEFTKQIALATSIQNYLIQLWTQDLIIRGYPVIEIADHGCGNDGQYLVKADSRADYLINILGREPALLELKTNPGTSKSTLKVSGLKNAVKEKAATLIMFNIPTRHLDFRNHIDLGKVEWAIFSWETAARLLSDYPHKPYYELGGKICVQLLRADYPKYWTNERLLVGE